VDAYQHHAVPDSRPRLPDQPDDHAMSHVRLLRLAVVVSLICTMNGNAKHGADRVDHYATRAIHVGSEPDPLTGGVVPTLSVATTFKQNGVGKHMVSLGWSLLMLGP
jgi:hypothetical protein